MQDLGKIDLFYRNAERDGRRGLSLVSELEPLFYRKNNRYGCDRSYDRPWASKKFKVGFSRHVYPLTWPEFCLPLILEM